MIYTYLLAYSLLHSLARMYINRHLYMHYVCVCVGMCIFIRNTHLCKFYRTNQAINKKNVFFPIDRRNGGINKRENQERYVCVCVCEYEARNSDMWVEWKTERFHTESITNINVCMLLKKACVSINKREREKEASLWTIVMHAWFVHFSTVLRYNVTFRKLTLYSQMIIISIENE